MDGCVKIKELPLLIIIQMPADMWSVLAIVGVLGGNLDHIDMGMLCGICRPLNRGPGPADACDDTVEELDFWNEEVVEQIASCPDSCASIEDCLLMLMEEGEGVRYI